MPTKNGYALKIGNLAQAVRREGRPVDPDKLSDILMDVSMCLQQMHERIEQLEQKD